MWLTLLLSLSLLSVVRYGEGEVEERVSLQSETDLKNPHITIEITNNLRSYSDGPVDDIFTLSVYDTISVTVGDFKHAGPEYIRQWAMWQTSRESEERKSCFLVQVYHYGEEAVFSCENPGVYQVYAYDPREYHWGALRNADGLQPLEVGDFVNKRKMWITPNQLKPFLLQDPEVPEELSHFSYFKNYIDSKEEKNEAVVRSDPISITVLDYCYYWNYKIEEIARSGYIYNDLEPNKALGGSYIQYLVQVWIIEPHAVTKEETQHHRTTPIVSEYSEILTTKFHAKGLFPCIKKSHGAIEAIGDVDWNPIDKTGNSLGRSHWSILFRLHTDTLISTFVTIKFTLSSRQRASLYNCFVGDTQVHLNTRTFSFMRPVKTDKSKLRLEVSKIGAVRKKYLEQNNQYFYGHGITWLGSDTGRKYQPSSMRTDVIVFPNQCGAQEFACVGGSRLQVVNALLEKKRQNVDRVYFPALDDKDSEQYDYIGAVRHKDYFLARDVAFTPTHFVVLMDDSGVYLHPTSLYIKGIGYVSTTKKFRIGSLVKRAWCADTGYLTHNMFIPAFSRTGNFILIQIYPIETNTHVKVIPPYEGCLLKGQYPPATNKSDEDIRNETLIHLHEQVARSDEVGRLINPPAVKQPNPPITVFDGLITFIANKGEIFEKIDPHFPDELSNPATKKLGTDYSNYNLAIVYVLDSLGQKTQTIFLNQGLITPARRDMDKVELKLQDVKFTAAEKRFLIASQFTTDEDIIKDRNVILAIMTVNAIDFAVRIVHTEEDVEEDLETNTIFPGTLLVRKNMFLVPKVRTLSPDEIEEDDFNTPDIPFDMVLYSLNTALPTYVISLGDVYVYASLDGRFAKPLSFIKRADILNKKGLVSNDDAITDFYGRSTTETLHDLVCTQSGTLSVLWRKPMRGTNTTSTERQYNSAVNHDSQSVALGSVFVTDALREVKPFGQKSRIFQMVTPDDEIIYGKFTLQDRPRYKDCREGSFTNGSRPDTGCVVQCRDSQPTTEADECEKRFCTIDNSFDCYSWKPAVFKDGNCNFTSEEQINRCNNEYIVWENDVRRSLKLCKADGTTQPPCVYELPECRRDDTGKKLNKSETFCADREPKHKSIYNIEEMQFLSTPYNNFLDGNLGFRDLEDDEREPDSTNDEDDIADDSFINSNVCPYSNFKLFNTPLEYAEVGYKTRITAEVSYFGKNIPSEADLLVEFEDVLGIKVGITFSLSEEKDQTTVTKAIDIDFTMTDVDLQKLAKSKNKYAGTNQFYQQDDAVVFSITFRPSIVNLNCGKRELIKTMQINVGCHPFTIMRLIYEATPLNRIEVVDRASTKDANVWTREGDYLSVPRKEIHHRQRSKFQCAAGDGNNSTNCKIPYANLYGKNVFNISWRDPIYPKFEQFLTRTSRRVTGNVVVYDLLGESVNLNLTRLKARCYNNGGHWYQELLKQQKHLGKTTNISVHEDIYQWYKDCHDESSVKETPLKLANISFRLQNLSNDNFIKFSRHPNPRNKIYIFRAVVVNTYYNKYTYCKTLETYFLVKITGIPTPRKALQWWFYIIMGVGIMAVLAFTYIHFSFSFAWKGETATTSPVQIDSNADTTAAFDDDDILDEDYLRDEEHIEFDFTQRVPVDNMFTRFAGRVFALTRWKNKAAAAAELAKAKEEKNN